jgi:peptide deformylase
MECQSNNPLKIVAFDAANYMLLHQKTELFKTNELKEARRIASELKKTLLQYSPAAGLAAPQIGILRSIFIYSYDRDPEHLEVIINPSINQFSEDRQVGWEACFSSLLSQKIFASACISRSAQIEVTYLDIEGKVVSKRLEGFSSKVFQHEYDHLQGVCNIYRKEAKVKHFDSKEALQDFMKEVHQEDKVLYIKPQS